jgi:hypothetical protein
MGPILGLDAMEKRKTSLGPCQESKPVRPAANYPGFKISTPMNNGTDFTASALKLKLNRMV